MDGHGRLGCVYPGPISYLPGPGDTRIPLDGRGDLEALRREDSRRWLPILDREDAPQNYRGDAVNALNYLARAHLLAGELTTAALMLEEDHLIAEATGNPPVTDTEVMLAAWRGREPEACELIEATVQEATGGPGAS